MEAAVRMRSVLVAHMLLSSQSGSCGVLPDGPPGGYDVPLGEALDRGLMWGSGLLGEGAGAGHRGRLLAP